MTLEAHDREEEGYTLRDHLALDRTRLANERTLLAYVRTSIVLFASGITLIKLFPDSWLAQIPGWAFVPIALGVAALGMVRFGQVNRRVRLITRKRENL